MVIPLLANQDLTPVLCEPMCFGFASLFPRNMPKHIPLVGGGGFWLFDERTTVTEKRSRKH